MSSSIVETCYGKVQGTSADSVSLWKGIPYAKPPVGNLRFHAPQPPASWAGVRDTSHFGLTALQPDQLSRFFGGKPEPSGEDCLFLNIWSPAADDQRRPVLFWIHGGAFVSGSGSVPTYDGSAFVRNGDVVVVTINYRLGVLGFLNLDSLGGAEKGFTNNCGLLDQIAALQWVRDNIASFGGDPENITVFGESAGAMSIGVLLAMPEAKGLFRRAILESGAAQNVLSAERATRIAGKLLMALNVSNVDTLLDIPADQILAAQTQVSQTTTGLAFQPTVDGRTLPEKPLNAISHGSAPSISLVIGTNRDEMRLFTLMDPAQATFDQSSLDKQFGPRAGEVANVYQAAHPGESLSDAWVDILTDRTFRIPAIRLAERQSTQASSVWMYRFDWASPAFGGALKSCHALELPFVWDNLDKPGLSMFTQGATGIQPLADVMHSTWIAFARTGDPSIPALPDWPPYDLQTRPTMIFNLHSEVVNDPQSAERRLWEEALS
jgi:para-nitrobenzyl esterase